VIFDISGNGTVGPEDLALALPRVPEATYGVGALYDLDLGSPRLARLARQLPAPRRVRLHRQQLRLCR
jgi:hypothetical protein